MFVVIPYYLTDLPNMLMHYVMPFYVIALVPHVTTRARRGQDRTSHFLVYKPPDEL